MELDSESCLLKITRVFSCSIEKACIFCWLFRSVKEGEWPMSLILACSIESLWWQFEFAETGNENLQHNMQWHEHEKWWGINWFNQAVSVRSCSIKSFPHIALSSAGSLPSSHGSVDGWPVGVSQGFYCGRMLRFLVLILVWVFNEPARKDPCFAWGWMAAWSKRKQ